MMDRELLAETLPQVEETEELPLRVVPDWDDQVRRADQMCRLIDRHLNAEAQGRLLVDVADFRPEHMCPEQRVQMMCDVYAVTR